MEKTGDNMSEINKSKKEEKNEEVQLEKKIDQEALDVVFRLYDETFKDLVER